MLTFISLRRELEVVVEIRVRGSLTAPIGYLGLMSKTMMVFELSG